jgi:hypothetical protein
MTRTCFVLGLVLTLGAASCGGSSANPGAGDTGQKPDLSAPPTPADASTPDLSATIDASTPPAIDLSIAADLATPADLLVSVDATVIPTTPDLSIVQCTNWSECGGNPCCVAVNSGAFSGTTCTTSASGCSPTLNIFSQTGVTRTCVTDSDCTSGTSSSQLSTCCTANAQGQTLHVCFSSAYTSFTGGVVTCP